MWEPMWEPLKALYINGYRVWFSHSHIIQWFFTHEREKNSDSKNIFFKPYIFYVCFVRTMRTGANKNAVSLTIQRFKTVLTMVRTLVLTCSLCENRTSRSHDHFILSLWWLPCPENVVPVSLARDHSPHCIRCRNGLLQVSTCLLAWIACFIGVIVET